MDMKTHKATTQTPDGEITIWIVSDPNCLTFRVSTFKMGENYVYEHNNGHHVYDLHVEAFDQDSFEWKDMIKTNDFSNDEIKAMIESDNVLVEVKDFLRTFFGIRMCMDDKGDKYDDGLSI
jgi:hypothetical protein